MRGNYFYLAILPLLAVTTQAQVTTSQILRIWQFRYCWVFLQDFGRSATTTSLGIDTALGTFVKANGNKQHGFKTSLPLLLLIPGDSLAKLPMQNRAFWCSSNIYHWLGIPGAAFVFQLQISLVNMILKLVFWLQSLDTSLPYNKMEFDYGLEPAPTTFQQFNQFLTLFQQE